MREIKFRVWNRCTESMSSSGYVHIYSDGSVDCDGYMDEDIVLMQYTGLKDKNGKEIYEGDILKHTEEDGTVDVGVCQWSTSYKPGFDTQCQLDEHLEVIGNIYENPELLK